MTIKEAIDLVNDYRPSLYTEKDKVKWLSHLDQAIFNEVILTHRFDAKYMMFKVSADVTADDEVSLEGKALPDDILKGTWFRIGSPLSTNRTPVYITGNVGNTINLSENITCSAGDVVYPIAQDGYIGISNELFGSIPLLVPAPYDEDVYINYLESRIDKENAEIAKYNVDVTLYREGYSAFTDWHNRTNKPFRKVPCLKL